MSPKKIENTLFDPRTGGQAIRTESVRFARKPIEPPRTNCFSIYLILSGTGTVWADTAQFNFAPGALIFFVPYQHIKFLPSSPMEGEAVHFHANFLCVETFHAEVGCSGILFNDLYGSPIVELSSKAKSSIKSLIDRIREEQQNRDLAYAELMLAYLKILLIQATRLKSSSPSSCSPGADPRHPILAPLRELIEQNYCTLHAPADYAKRLHMTPKTLGKNVRELLGTTLTDLIRSRILIHAKWQLLHTLRPVKEISRELGFKDELYFSRLFKKATGYSPTFFREFETEIRGGSNLSIPSGNAPILSATTDSDT